MDVEVPKERYAGPVTIETCHAFYVELEPLEGLRTQFMFWRHDRRPKRLTIFKPRIRDLRPGDMIIFEGIRRRVRYVQIFR